MSELPRYGRPTKATTWIGIGLVTLMATAAVERAASAGSTGAAPPPPASELPPGPVKRALLDVRSALREHKVPDEAISEPYGAGLRAAERARGAKAASDRSHGSLLEKLSQRWATVARTIIRAIVAERKSEGTAKRIEMLETTLQNEQAVLDEQQGRAAQLRIERKRLRAGLKKQMAKVTEKEQLRIKEAADKRRKVHPKGKR